MWRWKLSLNNAASLWSYCQITHWWCCPVHICPRMCFKQQKERDAYNCTIHIATKLNWCSCLETRSNLSRTTSGFKNLFLYFIFNNSFLTIPSSLPSVADACKIIFHSFEVSHHNFLRKPNLSCRTRRNPFSIISVSSSLSKLSSQLSAPKARPSL